MNFLAGTLNENLGNIVSKLNELMASESASRSHTGTRKRSTRAAWSRASLSAS